MDYKDSNEKSDLCKNENKNEIALFNSNKSDKNNDNVNLYVNKNYLTNEEYIKLFYNSNNAGVNKNFSLNVIRNKNKSKNEN